MAFFRNFYVFVDYNDNKMYIFSLIYFLKMKKS